ncbi:nitrogen fixation protein nifu [Mycoplasmopsis caviae]|uniref:Nitrogen fixation protein nifu n=1 Tax=Mycoplasmopsis caviae TaxID=55603 RepID=A0A3P8K9J7_9BACT|nr:iron-sulfur cluster assembly scaffold protein [Mycoplasmopsis caviae]VDR42069.1 nitrogen fixation protein nifu [Mycoplasmopsis caviae]
MFYNNDQKRQIIMEHYLNPKHKSSDLKNKIIKHGESCADYLECELVIENSKIKDIKFNGQGCAFFIASTDLLIELIIDKKISESTYLIGLYEKFILGEELKEDEVKKLETLSIFDNVKSQFNRVNCALMLARAIKEKLTNE